MIYSRYQMRARWLHRSPSPVTAIGSGDPKPCELIPATRRRIAGPCPRAGRMNADVSDWNT